MIRDMHRDDIGPVADIWLDTNIRTHAFIPSRYWESHFGAVKGMLLEAELYVYEDGGGIQGFIGLDGDYIAGIFIRSEAQSRGIGKELLDFVKARRDRLALNVYRKNGRAVRFYLREGFAVQQEQTDGDTGESEYRMLWER